MGCLSQSKVTDYLARIARIDSQLDKLYLSFDSSLEKADVEEYRFDSGDGSQKTIHRDPNKILDMIRGLESRRDWYAGQINGSGITSVNMRRERTTGGRVCGN
jgi:hypothetical protein